MIRPNTLDVIINEVIRNDKLNLTFVWHHMNVSGSMQRQIGGQSGFIDLHQLPVQFLHVVFIKSEGLGQETDGPEGL